MSTEPRQHVEYTAPPSAAYVRQYLRGNLFDGDENGILTVTISHHLDYLTELVLDLYAELHPEQYDGEGAS